jgi:hypothetical protein
MAESAEKEEEKGSKLEIYIGLLLAVFAAVLALNDLGAGRYGDDEKIAHNKHTEMYNWYQSKSIKQSLVKGQIELMRTLEQADALRPELKEAMSANVAKLQKKIDTYEREMTEIQQGSAAVGKENWAQDVNGEMGKIKGAEEFKVIYEKLNDAGDTYDLATLFLQMCLVCGAISLILQGAGARKAFIAVMVVLGLIGSWYCWAAYSIAFTV